MSPKHVDRGILPENGRDIANKKMKMVAEETT